MRRIFVFCSLVTLALQVYATRYNILWAWSFVLTLPLIGLGFYEMLQTRHTIMRNYPLLGRLRYIMEELRPKIYQYFIESDTDGTPISRIHRAVVYQRAKKALASTPFGTQLDVYQPGYEWINHSMQPRDLESIKPEELRVHVGGPDCKKPYLMSILNISAMSYGALSKTAIEALNLGAKTGHFAHNTGEGGISSFHLKHGGDLIWQIGTGYFGCRDEEGNFNEDKFKEKAAVEAVKMIEIKLSQGAKPGHGGILPAEKNTEEIAKIRGVKAHTTVNSPSYHSAFSGAKGLLLFVKRLRELSGGKPIGFKFCYGKPSEFDELCEAMLETGITPDFITVDGGEGGTGAAPIEFSNSIGMPLREGIVRVSDALMVRGLRNKIKIVAAGKIITGFDIIRVIALGADACYAARAMMLSLGCIQALECNKNTCPAGVATQDPRLYKGLVVADKFQRVANFHHDTVEAVAEILAATGYERPSDLRRTDVWRRVTPTEIKNYEELYPYPITNLTQEKLKKSLEA